MVKTIYGVWYLIIAALIVDAMTAPWGGWINFIVVVIMFAALPMVTSFATHFEKLD